MAKTKAAAPTRSPIAQRRGDECLRACAAFILNIDYEDTPSVSAADAPTDTFWGDWTAWAEQRGTPMLFYYQDHPRSDLWIACVPSLAFPGRDHAVVMQRTLLLLDPARFARYEAVRHSDVRYGIAFEGEAS